MTYREAQALRAWKEQIAQEEQAAQREKDRPRLEAEEQLRDAAVQLGKLQRERILNGKDDEFKPDEALSNAHMTISAASDFNAEQFSLFADTTDLHLSESNIEAITDFLWRQGVQISSAETFRRAAERLSDYGLLELAPAPEPLSEPVEIEPILIEQDQPRQVQRLYDGWDPNTGEPRQYTEFEASQLTADQWRRAMKIPSLNSNRPSSDRIR
jgi:hypothetical protein